MSAPLTDETGLHARDCECPTCEAGFRPTELERAAARRALAAPLAARAAISRNEPAVQKPRQALQPPVRPKATEPWPDKTVIQEQLRNLGREPRR